MMCIIVSDWMIFFDGVAYGDVSGSRFQNLDASAGRDLSFITMDLR